MDATPQVAADAPRPAWTARLSPTALVALLALVATAELMGWWYGDPDFYLPDPFRALSLAMVVGVALTMALPWGLLRGGLQVLLLTTVAAVLILELKAGVRDDVASFVVQTDDKLLRYHYRPGATIGDATVNSYGLLDVERPLDKPADVLRVVILTGSIANDPAVPFESRFVRQLQAQLDGLVPGHRVEVINASCEGFNTLQQVRLLEQVGLRYQPDVVVIAFMMTSATLQNGGHRRIGNSYFAFRFLPMLAMAREGSICALFSPYFERYSFDLIVRNSFERLALLARQHRFAPLVAVLPVVERFDDPVCVGIYDQVAATATDAGLPALRLAQAFVGQDPLSIAKPDERWDVCHPNAHGHAEIAKGLRDGLLPLLQAQARR